MESPIIPMPVNPNQPSPSIRVSFLPPVNKLMIPQITVRPVSRVVLVNGMPPMVPYERIKQLFDRCGRINDIWKNHLNIFFIEFENETGSFNALLMTGFNVVIEGDMRFCTQLMVNYALEHELKIPVIPFTRENFNMVAEKLSHESTLCEGANILTKWFHNGECNPETADAFFTLLRITSECVSLEKERMRFQEVENRLDEAVNEISEYLGVLEQIFNHENFQAILPNFPEEERQNLIKWKKEFEEAKAENNMDKEMLAREKKNTPPVMNPIFESENAAELLRLRREKEELELQLDVANLALVNERIEQQHEISMLKDSVSAAKQQCAEYEAQLADWRRIHAQLRKSESEELSGSKDDRLTNTEARIITELSTYLKERLGATMSDTRNHLRRRNFNITPKNITQLMRRFPNLFREVNVGSGPTKKSKWVYVGCSA